MEKGDNELEQRIKKIGEHWFLTEPLLFAAYCTHELAVNKRLRIPFRAGKKRIEYSPVILSPMRDNHIEEFLKIEILRIILKHPYQRQPPFAKRKVLTHASNATINDASQMQPFVKDMLKMLNYSWPEGLPSGLCFEEYYALIYEILSHGKPHTNCGTSIVPSDRPSPPDDDDTMDGNEDTRDSDVEPQDAAASGVASGQDGGSQPRPDAETSCGEIPDKQKVTPSGGGIASLQDAAEQASELWEEDEDTCCAINSLIEIAEASQTWGSLDGKLQGLIKASMKVLMDYRRMLSIFKTSVLSSKRSLTRMRPSRRFGFANMGSRYNLATNLLVAVDVSGSVTDKSLAYFFSVINRFFKYGIEKLDVIQFDHELKSDKPLPLKKAKGNVKIIGRGGTSFQPAADFYCAHPEYDGLIYFTDGYAPAPEFKTKRVIDVLWVLCGKEEYEWHVGWIRGIRRNRATYIPVKES